MIWSDLLCCLSPIPTPSPVLPTQDDKIAASCVFCNPSPDRFDIILQDAHYLVFKDRSPAALRHLLVIPRDHVPNVKSLEGPQGATIVKGLELIGREALSKVIRQGEESNEFRFGFHIPPFRSVEHLHLHCLVLPFQSSFKAIKYRVAKGDPSASSPTSKGWGWFVTASQAIEILERGGKVKVSAC